jgi:hypothetical protein
MRAIASLIAAFSLGAATATLGALAIAHQMSTSTAQAQARRDAQTAAMLRVAENALRNPLLVSGRDATEGEPSPLVLEPAGSSATSVPLISAAPVGRVASAAQRAQPAKGPAPDERPKPRQAGAAASQPITTGATAPAQSAQVPSAAVAAAPPVPAVDIARVLASVPVEGVSYDKASVARLERGAVVLRDGRRIAVGGHFDSGESLLAVDIDNSRIITNQRQILLFGQQQTAR